MSLILGIESSCDETAAALVASDRRILAHRLAGQEAAHRPYGGVVPEIAARAHVEILPRLIEEVLAEAGIDLAEVDAIAATAGPGLIGGVMVGLVTAKGLALAAGKPLIAVNHLEGPCALADAERSRLLHFPICCCSSRAAIANCCSCEASAAIAASPPPSTTPPAKRSTRPRSCSAWAFPAGPAVEQAAQAGDARRGAAAAPAGRLGRAAFLLRRVEERRFAGAGLGPLRRRRHRRLVPAGGGRLPGRPHQAGDRGADGATALVVAGGVAANQAIRAALTELAAANGLPFVAPPLWLCTDNAAMIAWAGALRFEAGLVDGLDAPARARWPLDPDAEKARGAGVKA